MPNSKKITVTDGNMSVTGDVTATKFNGDGSALTNVTPKSHPHSQTDVTNLTGDLGKKADTATVNPLIRTKADAAAVYTQAQIDTKLGTKPDTSTVYTRAQVDAKVTAVTAGVSKILPGTGINVSPSAGTGNVTVGITSVNSAILGDTSVSAAKIKNGAISDANISSSAAIAYSKIAGTPTSLPPSGTAGGGLSGTYPNPSVASGAITFAKIAPNAIGNGANQVAPGNQTGIGYFEYNNIGYENSVPLVTNQLQSIVSLTINAPSAGYVIVNASASVNFNETPTATQWIGLGISNTISAEGLFNVVNGNGSMPSISSWAQTRGFPVTAGSNTFYVLCRPLNTNVPAAKIGNCTITAFFSPNLLN